MEGLPITSRSRRLIGLSHHNSEMASNRLNYIYVSKNPTLMTGELFAEVRTKACW